MVWYGINKKYHLYHIEWVFEEKLFVKIWRVKKLEVPRCEGLAAFRSVYRLTTAIKEIAFFFHLNLYYHRDDNKNCYTSRIMEVSKYSGIVFDAINIYSTASFIQTTHRSKLITGMKKRKKMKEEFFSIP